METDLTKAIKKCTHAYSPKLKSQMRTIRWADEVWTPTGIVDSIRFEDYYASDRYMCPIVMPEKFFTQKEIEFAKNCCEELGKCLRDGGTEVDRYKCHGCVWLRHTYTVGMMVTCFEVKITKSDFLSPNGHNFHGNENYYCVPKELAPKIENLVPEGIGILAYTGTGLRKYRACEWKEIDDKLKVELLYNAMKKWCDGAVFLPSGADKPWPSV